MKIMYLCPKQEFDAKMSRVRFQQIAAIAVANGDPVHYFGPGWSGWDGLRTPSQNILALPHHPELVVVYWPKEYGVLDVANLDTRTRTVVQYNEAYGVEKVDHFVRDQMIDLVVFHHANDLPRYPWWDESSIKRVHVHHCADPAVYKDYGQEKVIDVLVAGNLNTYYYPMRYRLMQLAKFNLAKRGYRVKILQHPGYTLPPREGTVVGEEFARLINRSKLVFTCSMRYHYALAKYSEIALCNSLAVADVPDERQEFFRDTVCVVEPWMTDDQILRKVEDLLDDASGELRRLTAKSRDLTFQTSTMGQYADRFLAAAQELF